MKRTVLTIFPSQATDLCSLVREAVSTLITTVENPARVRLDLCNDSVLRVVGPNTLASAIYRVIAAGLFSVKSRNSSQAVVYISCRRRPKDGMCLVDVVTLLPKEIAENEGLKIESDFKTLVLDPDLKLAERVFNSTGGQLLMDLHRNPLGLATRFQIELPEISNLKESCTVLHPNARLKCK